nr:hypothetical protein [Curtobacterium sp. MCLR17_043]
MALANASAATPPQFSLPQVPVAKASVMALRPGSRVDTRLLLDPTTGIRVPVTAVFMTFVFQSRFTVMSLYGLKTRPLAVPVLPLPGVVVPPPPGVVVPPPVPPPVQVPDDVHGWPLPVAPEWVAGSSPWVHQFAV